MTSARRSCSATRGGQDFHLLGACVSASATTRISCPPSSQARRARAPAPPLPRPDTPALCGCYRGSWLPSWSGTDTADGEAMDEELSADEPEHEPVPADAAEQVATAAAAGVQ